MQIKWKNILLCGAVVMAVWVIVQVGHVVLQSIAQLWVASNIQHADSRLKFLMVLALIVLVIVSAVRLAGYRHRKNK